MTDLLERDAAALHRALAESGNEMTVPLSRETAELMSRLIDARARGEQIIVSPAAAEASPTEAAVLLAMSRPQVRKLMDRGLLESRIRSAPTTASASPPSGRSSEQSASGAARRWPNWQPCRTSSV